MDHQTFAQLLGNYGEFVGAIAVVATLFYLALQVRHSKEATKAHTQALEADRKIALANMYHARAAEAAAGMRMLADSQVAQISLKHLNSGFDSLDAEERIRLFAYHMNNYNRLDASHYVYEQDLLPEFGANFKGILSAYRNAWQDLNIPPQGGRASFMSYIEEVWHEENSSQPAFSQLLDSDSE
jgi:hypothetical protein